MKAQNAGLQSEVEVLKAQMAAMMAKWVCNLVSNGYNW